MHLHLRAIGKLKEKASLELLALYQKRLPWTFSITENELKKHASPQERKEAEGAWLLSDIKKGSLLLALDEHGKQYTSLHFAQALQQWREQYGAVTFLIGGADGLSDDVKRRAQQLLSFGAMTWPHQLVRVMLAEQLYRASTILAGHPYHRE